MYELNNTKKCPKCGYTSGDSWSQCEGACPMQGSPNFNEETAKQYGQSQMLTEVLPNNGTTINEEV